MNRLQYLLQVLQEECDETSQRASKASRFTLEEIQHGQNHTNAERLVYEFNDLFAVMEMLHDEGYISKIIDRDAIKKKKKKIEFFIEYSRKLGTVS